MFGLKKQMGHLSLVYFSPNHLLLIRKFDFKVLKLPMSICQGRCGLGLVYSLILHNQKFVLGGQTWLKITPLMGLMVYGMI